MTTSTPREGRDSAELWAITCYFNPAAYRSRLRNYRTFRRNLSVPLVTVELACNGPFELTAGDADVLVQLRCPDVLWQKERLLNIAYQHVPPGCQSIAYLDCDVVFLDEGWRDRVLEGLQRFPLVHAFDVLYDLAPGVSPSDPLTGENSIRRESIVVMLDRGAVPLSVLARTGAAHRWRYTAGHAWAARRELLDEHGFYDARILGGGNKVIFTAAYGRVDDPAKAYAMNRPQNEHFLAWARPYHEAVQSNVGCVSATLCHLWHGVIADRGYVERYQEFERFDFDPYRDIGIDAAGCWRWTSEKPELHAFLTRYMHSRNEDGSASAAPPAVRAPGS